MSKNNQRSFFEVVTDFLFQFRKTETEIHKCTLPSEGSLSFLPPLGKRAPWYRQFLRALKKSTLISEDNPQSTEYFRSKAEILRVRKEHVQSNTFIIHPFSDFRAYYELWMSLVWFVILLYMPIAAAFDQEDTTSTLREAFVQVKVDILAFILRLIGLADIIITFLTGYPVKKKRRVVMKPLKIAKNYASNVRFVTDLLTSLPLDFAVYDFSSQKVFYSLGFLRIVRLPTLYSYMTRSMNFFGINNAVVHIIKNVMINYIVFNWFACLHYMIPQIRFFTSGEVLAESWIEKVDLVVLDFFTKYIVCLYRATGNLFCITFDTLQSEVWEEKLLAILTFMFGKVYVFYLTVVILNHLLKQTSLEIKYFETISQVQAYMSQKQLPMSMQARLLQFYDYKYNKRYFKDQGITSMLSENLKGEIRLNVCSKLVQSVDLLAHLPQQQLEQIVINLKPEIYFTNDIIIKAGSVGDCMYFLASGTVGVWTPSGKEVCHLQDGAYFGEISLVFKDKRRTANIVAIEICEVYKLDRRAFRNCFKANPDLYKVLEDVAKERMDITQVFEDVHAKTFLEL